jgi:hypothetical protein
MPSRMIRSYLIRGYMIQSTSVVSHSLNLCRTGLKGVWGSLFSSTAQKTPEPLTAPKVS